MICPKRHLNSSENCFWSFKDKVIGWYSFGSGMRCATFSGTDVRYINFNDSDVRCITFSDSDVRCVIFIMTDM